MYAAESEFGTTTSFGINPTEICTYVQQKTWVKMFIAALFVIARNWKQAKCPSTVQ